MSNSRNLQLGIIHRQARELGLGEHTYRSALLALTGKRSAGDMTDAERSTVVRAFDAILAERKTAEAAREVVTDAEAWAVLG